MSFKPNLKMLLLASTVSAALAASAHAAGPGVALDPSGGGAYQIAESEYHLPASVDPLVDSGVTTEL